MARSTCTLLLAAAAALLLTGSPCSAAVADGPLACRGSPRNSLELADEQFTGVYANGAPGVLYVAEDEGVDVPTLARYRGATPRPTVDDDGLLEVSVPEGGCAQLHLPRGFNLTALSANGGGHLALGPLGNLTYLQLAADGASVIESASRQSVAELVTSANGPANITLARADADDADAMADGEDGEEAAVSALSDGAGLGESQFGSILVDLADGMSTTYVDGAAVAVEVRLLNGASSVYVRQVEESLEFTEVFDGASAFRTEGSPALVVTGTAVRGPATALKIVEGDCAQAPGGCTVVQDSDELWA